MNMSDVDKQLKWKSRNRPATPRTHNSVAQVYRSSYCRVSETMYTEDNPNPIFMAFRTRTLEQKLNKGILWNDMHSLGSYTLNLNYLKNRVLKLGWVNFTHLTIIGWGWAKYGDLSVASRSIICQSFMNQFNIELNWKFTFSLTPTLACS